MKPFKSKQESIESLQARYYDAKAARYDAQHLQQGDEHYTSLSFISALVGAQAWLSVLDVGCGTGKGIQYLLQNHPHLEVQGLEAMQALIAQASEKGVPPSSLVQASGLAMPFADNSFDAVMALGVLHHVEDPVLSADTVLLCALRDPLPETCQ